MWDVVVEKAVAESYVATVKMSWFLVLPSSILYALRLSCDCPFPLAGLLFGKPRIDLLGLRMFRIFGCLWLATRGTLSSRHVVLVTRVRVNNTIIAGTFSKKRGNPRPKIRIMDRTL